jgi:IS30 family transposase
MQHPVVNYGAMRRKKQSKKKEKNRAFRQLTLEERTKIEVRYHDGWGFRTIARYLGNGRTGSAVMREIDGRPRRGAGKYQAHRAHEKALERRKGKHDTRLKNDLVRKYVVEKLKLGWSPEQIKTHCLKPFSLATEWF